MGVSATSSPPATARSTEAQQTLSALGTDHSPDSVRLRSLLNQSERIRLSLLALQRLRTRLSKDERASRRVAILDRTLAVAAELLKEVSSALHYGAMPGAKATELMKEFESTAAGTWPRPEDLPEELAATVSDARHQVDALAGQLRSVLDLTTFTSTPGREALIQADARRPLMLRLYGVVATLRANLSLHSAAFRHALRLCVAVAVGLALGRSLELSRAYWMPMTIAIILKPDFGTTYARGLLRFVGTFSGLVVSTWLVGLVYPQPTWEIALIALFAFVMRSWGAANYGILTAAVTAVVVLMFGLGGAEPQPLITARALNTFAGGLIALITYAAFPTWERTNIREVLARMLDSYREYFRALRQAYESEQREVPHELDQARLAARLARSNFEASIERLLSEPGARAEVASTLGGILSSSHRVVHAFMALDAGLAQSRPVPPRDAFRVYANGVELTLYYLAAALRGSSVTAEGLPDLRQEHNRLVAGGDPGAERYALVNVETDRITNSLNTLAESVLAALSRGRL
jgi:uncharacterized membrane protein YccC